MLEDGLQSAVQLVWILELLPTTNQSKTSQIETSAEYGNGYIYMMF
jgi:hypothetical protein